MSIFSQRRSRQICKILWGATRPVGALSAQPRRTPPPRRAPCRHEPPVIFSGFGLDMLCKLSEMPCMKNVYRDRRRRSTVQQPRTNSASRPVDKPWINWLATADFVPTIGLHRILLVRTSGGTFRRYVLDASGGTRSLFPGRTVLSASSSDRTRPVAPPCTPLRSARGMFEFWIRQLTLNVV